MQKKTIIFGAPDEFVSKKIIKSLQENGFEVIDICLNQNFKYPNFQSKIHNFFRKTFFRDTSVKKQLKLNACKEKINSELTKLKGKSDFTLIIRPDIYPLNFIESLKQKTNQIIGYQWDGLNRFPDIEKYIPKFDRFFVFDPKDVKDNLLPLTNFYFEENTELPSSENSIFFVGTYLKERFVPLKKLSEKLIKLDYSTQIFIRTSDKKVIRENKNSGINFIQELMSYEENQNRFKKARVVIDFSTSVHNGLTFRVFEAIGNNKKLITNNAEVKKYDFYNPDNFFVWEDENFEGLEEFLKKPYHPLSQNLKQKYSFTNWIHYVLDIEPHQKIELPKQ